MARQSSRQIQGGAPEQLETPSRAHREMVFPEDVPAPRQGRQRISASRRIVISQIAPQVEAGRFPIQRVVGDVVKVQASVMCDGDVVLNACILYRVPGESRWRHAPMSCDATGLKWTGFLRLQNGGRTQYGVEAWVSGFSTWVRDVRRCLDADAEATGNAAAHGLSRLCHQGAVILDAAQSHASGADLRLLAECAEQLHDTPMSRQSMQRWLKNRELHKRMLVHDERRHVTRSEPFLSVVVDRKRAVFAAWGHLDAEEFAAAPTADTCAQWARMGCEVLHVEGLREPQGIITCNEMVRSAGMELAVDIALPQPPDNHWRGQHPAWFAGTLDAAALDGTLGTVDADMTPNLDFWCEDRDALWDACHDSVSALVESGVRILVAPRAASVPLPFWEWLIPRIKKVHPDVLFVSGPMSREHAPALAWMGFSQSPQIWPGTDGLDVGSLLPMARQTDVANPRRPFVTLQTTTQDTALLVRMSALLAATLSPTYGIHQWPLYSEVQDWLRQLNRWRRDNRALQLLGNLQILDCSNPNILAFWRNVPGGRNDLVVLVNLHPEQLQEATVVCPVFADAADAADDADNFVMEDLIDAARYSWHAGSNPVRLDPAQRWAHVLRVVRRPSLLR